MDGLAERTGTMGTNMNFVISSHSRSIYIDLHWRSTVIHVFGYEFYYHTSNDRRRRASIEYLDIGETVINFSFVEIFLTNHRRAGSKFAL